MFGAGPIDCQPVKALPAAVHCYSVDRTGAMVFVGKFFKLPGSLYAAAHTVKPGLLQASLLLDAADLFSNPPPSSFQPISRAWRLP